MADQPDDEVMDYWRQRCDTIVSALVSEFSRLGKGGIMKLAIFWIGTLAAFGITNGMIAQKEALIRNGTTIYLELRPVDPRSLMQGDYMELRYNLNDVSGMKKWRGHFVVDIGEDKIAKIIRVFDGEELAENEHLLRYTNWSRGTRIGTDSFFFQEGHGNDYAQARYGELKVAPTGESILVTLRNSDMTEAGPPPKKAVIDER